MTVPVVDTSSLGLSSEASLSAKNRKASDAAGQFESLLIAQMLKSMREEESGWLGTGDDKTSDSAMGMAEEHLASALSASGGFGLSKVVSDDLKTPGVDRSVHHVPGAGGKRG
jgi:Rod binding domain-containing protein